MRGFFANVQIPVKAILPKRVIAQDVSVQEFLEEQIRRSVAKDSDAEFNISHSPLHGHMYYSIDLSGKEEQDDLVCQHCLDNLDNTTYYTVESIEIEEAKQQGFTCLLCNTTYPKEKGN